MAKRAGGDFGSGADGLGTVGVNVGRVDENAAGYGFFEHGRAGRRGKPSNIFRPS